MKLAATIQDALHDKPHCQGSYHCHLAVREVFEDVNHQWSVLNMEQFNYFSRKNKRIKGLTHHTRSNHPE